jgi:transcriptional regulator with XRE-family HTH domain
MLQMYVAYSLNSCEYFKSMVPRTSRGERSIVDTEQPRFASSLTLDHESLPQQDRLVLLRKPRAATPFAEKVVALMETRGLSAAGTARRVSCSPGYLSNVIRGRKRPSARVTARLDDVLRAGGELAALADTAMVVTGEDEPAPQRNPREPAGDTPAAIAGGLSLPYVPGRLVIEISGPAGDTAQIADGGEMASGPLALVRDAASAAPARAEVTGP